MRIAPVLVLFGTILSVGCGEPDLPTNRAPSEAGTDFIDDGGVFGDDDGGGGSTTSPCPTSIPKTGESCGPGVDEATSCDFDQGECLAPNGMYYKETVTYCCPQGTWEACGGTSPCDMFVDAAEPPPPDDAGVSTDANGDGGDGGNDAADALSSDGASAD